MHLSCGKSGVSSGITLDSSGKNVMYSAKIKTFAGIIAGSFGIISDYSGTRLDFSGSFIAFYAKNPKDSAGLANTSSIDARWLDHLLRKGHGL